MDGGWWEPRVSLLEWKVPDKQTEEARMIHVVLDESWRLQYELSFSDDIHKNIYSYVHNMT